MKRMQAKSRLLLLGMIVACLTGLATAVYGAETVQSPDWKIKIELELKDSKPFWNVRYGSNTIIQNGLLGVELSADNLSGSYTLAGTERATANTTWKPVWGFISEVRDNYNELTVKVQEAAGAKRLMHIVFRAYNEGVGMRYVFPEQPGMKDVTVKRFL
ncbi:MAG: glycoside hydrolase family 97 N-terminal domain-containing protein, partial [bacterium]